MLVLQKESFLQENDLIPKRSFLKNGKKCLVKTAQNLLILVGFQRAVQALSKQLGTGQN